MKTSISMDIVPSPRIAAGERPLRRRAIGTNKVRRPLAETEGTGRAKGRFGFGYHKHVVYLYPISESMEH